jgi:WD40 repeat protein
VRSVAFSADGQRILSTSDDSTIRVWDSRTGALTLGPLVGHTAWVFVALFSPNGKHIVSGSHDKTIRFWDAYQGHVHLEPLRGHKDVVLSVSFMPDGSKIASGSIDRTIRIWNASTGRAIRTLTDDDLDWVYTIAFSPDGKHLVSGSRDPTMRFWDTGTWQLVHKIETGSVQRVVHRPIFGQVCSVSRGTKGVLLWDMNLPSHVMKLANGYTDLVCAVAFSPDGTWLASGCNDGTLWIWDAVTGEPISDATGESISEPLTGHTRTVEAVAVSPDGTRIVSGSYDMTIRVYAHA